MADNLPVLLKRALIVLTLFCLVILGETARQIYTDSTGRGQTSEQAADGTIPEGERAGYFQQYRDMCKRQPESKLCK